jgi:flagellar biosynthetic protein FlhB
MVLLSGALVLMSVGGHAFADYAQALMQHSTAAIRHAEFGNGGLLGFTRAAAGGWLGAFVPFSMGVTLIVVLVNLIQARGVLSLTPITPKLSLLNPGKGIKRVFGKEGLFLGVKALFKLVAIGLITWSLLSKTLPQLINLSSSAPAAVATILRSLLFKMAITLGLSYLVLALFDFMYQRHKMEKNLKMSRQEVKEDHKDSEGNPHVKARIQAVARAMARRRMLQDVAGADVVVVNPTHIAVALKYDAVNAPAPMVVAMGERKLAQRIKDIARQANVPVVENRPVARALLATARVGQMIPPALYTAVAEILAFVYRQRNGLKGLPESMLSRRNA